MVEREKWIKRKFTFDLPVWMFPNVVERLRGTPARLEERVRYLGPDVLTRKLHDSWSIQENAGHLGDVEELWRARLDDFEKGLGELTPADMSNAQSKAAGHNSRRLDDVLDGFRRDRTDFVRRLESYNEEMVLRPAHHPRLDTTMRVIDLAFFAAEHDDHHLARITELIHAASL
jgi:uncharacterized damage-inducible protein DinB